MYEKYFTYHPLVILGLIALIISLIPIKVIANCQDNSIGKGVQENGGTCTFCASDIDVTECVRIAIEIGLISAIQPEIVTANPSQLFQGSVAEVSLTAPGAQFNQSSQVELKCGIIPINTVTNPPSSSTEITANVVIPDTIPADTSCDFIVTTALGTSETLQTAVGLGLLKILAKPSIPTIVSIKPTSVTQNTTTPLLIYGQNTHFTNNAIINFNDSGLTVANVRAESDTLLSLTLTVSDTAYTGFHDVIVKSGSEVATENQTGPLQVVASIPPQLVAINPIQALPSETVTMTVTGQNTQFTQGISTLKFSGNDIEVLDTTVNHSSQLTAKIHIADTAIPTSYDVYVVTAGEVVTLKQGFTIIGEGILPLLTDDQESDDTTKPAETTDSKPIVDNQGGSTTPETDFTTPPETVTNPPAGEKPQQVVSNDSTQVQEPVDKIVTPTTIPPSATSPTGQPATSPVVIEPAVLQFTQNAMTVDEFGHSSTILTVLVKRTVNCQEAVSVEYEIRPETATFPEDFQASTGQVLTWPKGDCGSKAIKIAMKDDTEVEEDETFSIALLPPSDMAELGEIDTIQVTIKDDDTSECNITQSLQPTQYDLLFHTDDKPLTLTFANAQSVPEIKQAPDPQVVTLELPMIYENKAVQLQIMPYGVGETTFIIGDCASQATVHVTVEPTLPIPMETCLSDNTLALKLDQPTITFLEEDKPIKVTVTGGQGQPRMTQAPNGEIVTLKSLTYLDYAAAEMIFVPRRPGKTELTLADCASEARLEIQVLKKGTIAHYCWLEGKTDGDFCGNENLQQKRVSPNSIGMNAKGEELVPATQFMGKITTFHAGEGESLVILPQDGGIKAQWTVFVDLSHHQQPADLLVVAKRQTPENLVEWWMLDGATWQLWDEDVATLTAMTTTYLPALLEQEVELDNLLLSLNEVSGEFMLYFGYRLNEGSLIFNGMKPLTLRIANSQNKAFRSYFAGNANKDTITMTIMVDPNHLNEIVNILMVAIHPRSGKAYMRLPDRSWHVWSGDLESITSTENNVKLKSVQKVSIFTAEQLAQFREEFAISSGNLKVHVGYLLKDNTVVYNRQPLEESYQR